MTERIDHVGEAHACEEAGLSVMRRMGTSLAPHMEAVMQFDLARLHAQLALVEQQRIANIISVDEHTELKGNGHVLEKVLRDEVREGLGL